MKQKVLIFLLAAGSVAAAAQTAAKPAAPAATATHKAATTSTSAVKLPPGVPPARGILHTAFSLKYQDVKIGTGADAEPNKMYKVQYTGWRAADGVKFDSSFDRPGPPVLDKDGKPEKGADGKPVLGPSQPMAFPQGMGRLIPGFDQGFTGMKVGGKRRLFIPWQLAYGTRDMPGRGTEHPGIPPKSDLIFDVELVDVAELPTPPTRPGMGGPGGRPLPPRPIVPTTPGKPATPGAPATAPTPGSAAPTTSAPAPATAPTTTTPAPPTTTSPAPAPSTTQPQQH
jgi:peptidylprolyl isomerase